MLKLYYSLKEKYELTHLDLMSIPHRGKNVVVAVCCGCFSHSAYWLPTRKTTLYKVANPARGLLNTEKKKKRKSGSVPPTPPQ